MARTKNTTRTHSNFRRSFKRHKTYMKPQHTGNLLSLDKVPILAGHRVVLLKDDEDDTTETGTIHKVNKSDRKVTVEVFCEVRNGSKRECSTKTFTVPLGERREEDDEHTTDPFFVVKDEFVHQFRDHANVTDMSATQKTRIFRTFNSFFHELRAGVYKNVVESKDASFPNHHYRPEAQAEFEKLIDGAKDALEQWKKHLNQTFHDGEVHDLCDNKLYKMLNTPAPTC